MMPRLATRILLLVVTVFCLVEAQAEAAGPRIGFLSPSTPASALPALTGLRQGLEENGYVDGKNITIESRFAHGRFDRLPDLAIELVRLPVDVLVPYTTTPAIAARDSTTTVPIVMVGVSDPIASGLVSNLARPGGNITGTSSMRTETASKWLQLLTDVAPGIRRVGVLWNPNNRVFHSQLIRETEAAARILNLELRKFEAHDLKSIETAFEAISKERLSGLNVLPDQTLFAHAPRIAALAEKARLPTVSGNDAYAEAGGLLAYGPSRFESGRSAGGYVAKILKGARPADLPVEQPTKFDLVINMKTAKRIGATIPPSLRLMATRVIE